LDGFHRFCLKIDGDDFSSVWVSNSMATVCEWFGLKTTQMVFVGLTSKSVVMVSVCLASKHVVTGSAGLASKPAATVSDGLGSKPTVTVSRFGPQNRRLWFGDLSLKITTMVSWFGPQNQAGFSLSILWQPTEGGQRGTRVKIYRFTSRGSKSGYVFSVWPED
jgi:hypothetical protein